MHVSKSHRELLSKEDSPFYQVMLELRKNLVSKGDSQCINKIVVKLMREGIDSVIRIYRFPALRLSSFVCHSHSPSVFTSSPACLSCSPFRGRAPVPLPRQGSMSFSLRLLNVPSFSRKRKEVQYRFFSHLPTARSGRDAVRGTRMQLFQRHCKGSPRTPPIASPTQWRN